MLSIEVKRTILLFAICIWVLSGIIYGIVLGNLSLTMLIWISVIQFFGGLALLFIAGYRILSFVVLFNCFSFLFHGGQLFLECFNIEAEKAFDIFTRVDGGALIESIKVYTCAQFCMILAFLLMRIIYPLEKKKIDTLESKELDLPAVFVTGQVLFLIGLIPRLYFDILQFIAFFRSGYLATYQVENGGYLKVLAYFFQIGILIMIIGKSHDKRKALLIAIISSLYLAVTTAKGGRATQVVSLFAIWFLYFKIVSKPNKKMVVNILVIIYCFIVVLSVVGSIRNNGASGYFDFGRLVRESFGVQVLWDSLGEFGGSAISLCYAVQFFPSQTPFLYGLTYLSAILVAIPKSSSIFGNLVYNWTFVDFFPNQYRFSLGGSLYGELYANFGFWGTSISSFILGVILGKYSNGIDKACKDGNWRRLSVMMMIFPSLLLWNRGYFADMIRQFFYSLVMFFVIYNFIVKRQRNK